ncbi:hypothetical protein OC846_002511 [Tilletia horrida]|uniref:TauD/TfdA-like domain-containing protein n=1 Tax=Tilletia horrida TaxID=155126 RepID=A0AAN6GS49_9BASI|nr:hypothetical protein OC845_003366 [Tilletia horrida]KAK0553462.1 hypothetical protein OC846_002511 [Tilletia horrida]KAK0568004.1 hypothetical protein OC861_002386 [Tilletia horrida]
MPALTLEPLPAPLPGVQRKLDPEFGRIVHGLNAAKLEADQLNAIKEALYKHSVLVFPNTDLSPEAQYELTHAFDTDTSVYGHGNKGRQKESILHPDLKTIPRQPQVQVIGNGPVAEHEGLKDIRLKHPHHKTFHKTKISDEEDHDFTRFYRWHIDAALYDLAPPRVTTLYGLKVPKGRTQTLRYDDGTGDELQVPLGTTAFVSGKTMFNRLSPAEKSLAVRSTIVYSPHPYVWMSKATSNSVGLGLESDGKELSEKDLPEWEESKVKKYPMLWKNPQTGELHFQVHPSAIKEVIVAPLPENKEASTDALYPQGAHLTDLKEVRDLVYRLQRPAIAPELVYAHDWKENDLCLFHNQGVLHSVVGAFADDEVRVFHQCNLAASTDPEGPSESDIAQFA